MLTEGTREKIKTMEIWNEKRFQERPDIRECVDKGIWKSRRLYVPRDNELYTFDEWNDTSF